MASHNNMYSDQRSGGINNGYFTGFQSNSRKIVGVHGWRRSNLTTHELFCSRVLRMYYQTSLQPFLRIILMSIKEILDITH